MKLEYKISLFKIVGIASIVLYLLTYAAQFITSEFFSSYIGNDHVPLILDVLFVLGISVEDGLSFWRQMYFYYLMIFLSLLQKLFLSYLIYEKEKREAKIAEEVEKNE